MPVKPIQQKDKLDRFYTKPEVAELCVNHLKKVLNDYSIEPSIWIEPSAGCGNFSNLVNCLSFDLEPQNNSIVKQDWFEYNITHKDCIVFGNPPFGSRNNLSKKFITKSISVGAKVIAFILPNTYNKLTIQKVFPDNWKLVSVISIPDNSFVFEGKDYHVPCVFQVWIDSLSCEEFPDLREQPVPLNNDLFEFTSKDKADIFVFGASPSKVIYPEEVSKNNRGYYLKAKLGVDILIEKLRNTDWRTKGNSSVSGGVAWFTKQEIVKIIKGEDNDTK